MNKNWWFSIWNATDEVIVVAGSLTLHVHVCDYNDYDVEILN